MSERMRIGMLTSAGFPPREGMGFYILNLSRHLTRLGHEVQIITRGRASRTTRDVVEGIPVWRPFYVPAYPFHVHIHDIFVDRLIGKLQSDLDVLHLHTPLVKWPKVKIPTLVTVHTPMKADISAIPVTDIHSLLIHLQGPASVRLEKQLFAHASKICAVARSVAIELQEYGIQTQGIAVLGNGVDTDIFSPGNPRPDPDRPYFLTVGRLGARKGLEDLIDCAAIAAREFPQARFVIAGSGPLQAKLERQIARLGLSSQVVLIGHVSDRCKLAEFYRGASAYIHPAHYEGLPTVLLEAMACGTPVIATAVSGTLDVIRNGENGFLVSPRSPQELAASLTRIIQNPELGWELACAGLKTIRERFTWQVVSRNYAALYDELLRKQI